VLGGHEHDLDAGGPARGVVADGDLHLSVRP
jgi:hypothetical protein